MPPSAKLLWTLFYNYNDKLVGWWKGCRYRISSCYDIWWWFCGASVRTYTVTRWRRTTWLRARPSVCYGRRPTYTMPCRPTNASRQPNVSLNWSGRWLMVPTTSSERTVYRFLRSPSYPLNWVSLCVTLPLVVSVLSLSLTPTVAIRVQL